MASDPLSRDWSGLAKQTLDTLIQRRDQVDSRNEDRRDLEDSALQRFAVAAVAIDEAWTEGAQRVAELEQEAEHIRDEVRVRTKRLETEQAAAIVDLVRVRSAEDLAVLLGVPVEQVLELVRNAEEVLERSLPEQAVS